MAEIFINLNGHNKSGVAREIPLTDRTGFSQWVALDIERSHARTSKYFTADQMIGLPIIGARLDRCGCCGESIGLEYQSVTDEKVVLHAPTACAYPEGMKPYDLMLGVPSGKIVFANDLRELIAIEDDSAELSSDAGQKKFSEAFIRAGLVYVFVGNTCPSVQRDGDGLKVGRFYHENEENLTDEEYEAAEAAMDAVTLGSICTDLWAYNAMDHDYFQERMKRLGIDPDDRSYFVVEVPPGVYAFSDELADIDTASVFSRIRRVEGAEYPKVDPGDIETSTRFADSHAAKSILTDKANRPTGLWKLEDMLCSLGMGYDWTDGFLRRGTRREDDPFAENISDYRKATTYDLANIVNFPRFPVKSIYSMTNSFGRHNIQLVPEGVDIWWLALTAMFAKTALAHPEAFDRPPRSGEDELQRVQESARSYEAMATAALVIGDLIHKRGIDIRPYCEEINAYLGEKGVFDVE